MTDSAHNLQKELADVNNLWKWPDKITLKPDLDSDKAIRPDFTSWYITNNSGAFSNANPGLCVFTDRSARCNRAYPQSYAPAVIIDLKSGNYVISFDADAKGQTSFMTFMWDGAHDRLTNGNSRLGYKIAPGRNSFEFEVFENACILWYIADDDAGKTPVTITNVRIREGVL